MTYNVFSGTLKPTQSINQPKLLAGGGEASLPASRNIARN